MHFTRTVLGNRGMPALEAIVFNHDGKELLGEATRAFLRHAVGKWYASMTAVHREKTVFIWQATFLAALNSFKNAVRGRKATSLRVLRDELALCGRLGHGRRPMSSPESRKLPPPTDFFYPISVSNSSDKLSDSIGSDRYQARPGS